MLIAIEGIDGSGKGTQSRRLVDGLNAVGVRAALLSFPRYAETQFGRAIGEFLNGRFGSLDQVHPFLASLLYAGDRFESRDVLKTLLAENDAVILDRYVASNLAHQGAKLDGVARRELLERIASIEYGLYGLPRADRTILLDLPVETARTLIARKPPRDYTTRSADLQEADTTYLTRVRAVYHELAAADPNAWTVIRCAEDNAVRPLDAIAADVRRAVEPRLAVAGACRGNPRPEEDR